MTLQHPLTFLKRIDQVVQALFEVPRFAQRRVDRRVIGAVVAHADHLIADAVHQQDHSHVARFKGKRAVDNRKGYKEDFQGKRNRILCCREV